VQTRWWACLGACSLLAACVGKHEKPDPGGFVRPHPTTEPVDSGLMPEAASCGEFCGETFLHEVSDPPNLYFVIDRSGSMGGAVPDSRLTKYQTARAVLAELLHAIGHRVRYGAAVFPAPQNPGECGPGLQVFPATLGALPGCDGEQDPQLGEFMRRLGAYAPEGATPTSLTLEALRPLLEELEGKTVVVLVTDGAPNCNLDAVCEADQCTLNIEGATLGTRACSPNFNCCDPDLSGPGMGGYCVDSGPTEAAIAALHEAGIPTYVVGMPGAEPYAALLGRLARAGGTAREGSAGYYAVSHTSELREALYAIGTGVAIRCSIELSEPPLDRSLVNVYFDGELVPADEADGWSWDDDARIVVNGDACQRLSSGGVIDARAVFGCDTVVR
jgi:hypothetical protein